jgi:hypothetical protein
MILLTFFAGLAIDGGRGYWEKRQAQNAAEHAALAAAWEYCSPSTPARTPAQAAVASATDNGFTHDGTNVWVTTTGSAGEYTVKVQSRLPTAFAMIMGFDSITASGRAVAQCIRTSGGGYAIFAGGNNCESEGKFQIDISGSNNIVSGAVHSNDNINVGGSDNEFDAAVTYVSEETHHDSTVFVNPYPSQAPNEDWPLEFSRDTYYTLANSGEPNMHYFVGDIDSGDITGPGLYYATGKIDLGGSDQEESLTLVSERDVIIGGSNNDYEPYMDNLLAFSAWDVAEGESTLVKRCDVPGVKVSGGHNDWRGFIYAPESLIDMSGSDTSTLVGSLIGWSVKVSGSSVNNTADETFLEGPPVLRLME